MNKAIKSVISVSFLFLSVAAFAEEYRIQVNPVIPVPVIIIPTNEQSYGHSYGHLENNSYQQYAQNEHHEHWRHHHRKWQQPEWRHEERRYDEKTWQNHAGQTNQYQRNDNNSGQNPYSSEHHESRQEWH